MARRGVGWLVSALSVLLFLLFWQLASGAMSPLFMPSPAATAQAAARLLSNGALTGGIQASLQRIMIGFVAGSLIGIVLGQLMGRTPLLSAVLSPYVSMFRFIPTIAILPVALLWLGPNEASKVFLVAYSSVFIVALGTAAGVAAVPEATIRAARMLGASRLQVVRHVIIPATVPSMVSSSLVALGFGFMVIVSAEMVGSRSGLGYLVSQGRQVSATAQIFVAIFALGFCGLLLDKLYRMGVSVLLGRYGVKL